MTQPTNQQWITLSSTSNGLLNETIEERILSALAVLASGTNPDGTTFTLSGDQTDLVLGGYISAANYLSGVDIGPAIQAWVTAVKAGTAPGNLFLPSTAASSYNGGYTAGTSPQGCKWNTPVYYDGPLPEQGIEITFDPQCCVYLDTGLATTTVGGNSTGLFALHLNESSSAPSYTLYGMRSNISGGGSSTYAGTEAVLNTATSSVTRRFVINRPTVWSTSAAKSSLFSPAFCVANTIGVRINEGQCNNLQYMLMSVNYTDAVVIDGWHIQNPQNAGVSTPGDTFGGEGCYYRAPDDGDALQINNGQGGSTALAFWLTGSRGAKITAPVGGAFIFENCSVTVEEGHWDGDQPSALAPTLSAQYSIYGSDVKIVGGWWHRSKLEQCAHSGVTTPVYPFLIDDNVSGGSYHNPSTLTFVNPTVHQNTESISGTDTAVPDIYINSKQEGTVVRAFGATGHSPHVTGTQSRIGMTVGAANSTLNTNVTTRQAQSYLASSSWELTCVSIGTAVSITKPGSVKYVPAVINQPTITAAPSIPTDMDLAGNYTPGTSGVVTGGNSGTPTKSGLITGTRYYAVCFDDGNGVVTPYQTFSADPSADASGLNLSNQGTWSAGTTYALGQEVQYAPANGNGGSGQTGSLTAINYYVTGTALTAALTSGVAVTLLNVAALPVSVASGGTVTVSSGGNSQTLTTTATAAVGATTITVTSVTANFSYPIGSLVQIAALPAAGTAPCNSKGKIISSGWSVVPQAVTIALSSWTQPGPCVMRLWESATSLNAAAGIGASPDQYVEIPVRGPCLLVDLGKQIAGWSWQTYVAQGTAAAGLVTWPQNSYAAGQLNAARTDSASVSYSTSSAVVTDAASLITDIGQPVTGSNITAGTYIVDVTPGVSFTLSLAPAGSGTSVTVGGDVAIAVTATTTFLATPPLQVGVWDISWYMTVATSATAPIEMEMTAGTATYSVVGGSINTESQEPSANGGQLTLRALIKVTAAGTVICQCHDASGTATATVKQATVSSSKAGATGFVGIKVS